MTDWQKGQKQYAPIFDLGVIKWVQIFIMNTKSVKKGEKSSFLLLLKKVHYVCIMVSRTESESLLGPNSDIIQGTVSSLSRLFLAHLSWKLKSVCLSVNCSHFHLLLQKYLANFNQTWHKVFLGEWDSSLFKWRAKPWANSNQTWHKAFLDNGDSSLFKWRAPLLSKGK